MSRALSFRTDAGRSTPASIVGNRGLLPCLLVVLLALFAGQAGAQYTPPLQVSSSDSSFGNLGIGRDVANNITFVFDDGTDVYYTSTLFGGGIEINITANALGNSHSRVATGGLGVSSVVYEQEGVQPGNQGNDILLINNNGGPFANPVNITFSSIDDRHPEIAQIPLGDLFVVYEQVPTGGSEIYLSQNGAASTFVEAGQDPVITATFDNAVHIGYRRDDQLFYRRYAGGVLEPEQDIFGLPGGEQLELARDAASTVHAVCVIGGAIHYTANSGTGFAAPLVVEPGPIAGRVHVSGGAADHVAVVYESGGQILVLEKTGGDFGAPTIATPAATAASGPVAIVDSLGYIHIGYEENDAILYTNNVPLPEANFSADVTAGELPLTVSFQNLSTGIFGPVLWDFGDGETSALLNPTHTYLTPGAKNVSLTVTGPGGSDTETKFNYIDCQTPSNVLRIESIDVFAAEQNIRHPVRADHVVGLQGFQLAVAYDSVVVPIEEVTLEDSATLPENPEFVFIDIVTSGDPDYFIVAIILDTEPPFDGRTIDPGENQILANIAYSMPIGIAVGTTTTVEFLNDELGDPPINNIFTVEGGQSVEPFLLSGTVTVVDGPASTFIRGDANYTFTIDLVDAIFLLNFLFNGGAEPPCKDAADFADSGTLGLPGAIGILSFLFSGGAPPDYPYPAAGLDPTPDALDCAP